MKTVILKTLGSAVGFAVAYGVICYIFDHTVNIAHVVIAAAIYFVVMLLLRLISPGLKKVTGHDKKDNE